MLYEHITVPLLAPFFYSSKSGAGSAGSEARGGGQSRRYGDKGVLAAVKAVTGFMRDRCTPCGGRYYFCQQVLQTRIVQHRVRQQPLEASVPGLQPAMPGLPVVEGRLRRYRACAPGQPFSRPLSASRSTPIIRSSVTRDRCIVPSLRQVRTLINPGGKSGGHVTASARRSSINVSPLFTSCEKSSPMRELINQRIVIPASRT